MAQRNLNPPDDNSTGRTTASASSASSPPSLSSSLSNIWSSFARSFYDGSTISLPENTQQTSSKHSFELPPLPRVKLSGYHVRTSPVSRILPAALAEEIRILIPKRLQLVEEWKLVYSLVQDGASLGTMYNRAKGYREGMGKYGEVRRAGFVLVVSDSKGGVGFPLSSCSVSASTSTSPLVHV